MTRIRIIHIVESLPAGGLERVVATIAAELDRSRFDPRVWCMVRGGPLVQKLRDRGVEVRILNLSTYHNPFSLLRFARALREAEAHVVHTHGYFPSTGGRLAALMAHVPIRIAHYHTVFYGLKRRNVLIDRLLNALSHQIVFVSENARASFAAHGYCMKNATVIYNGITTDGLLPWEGSSSGHVITIVASLTPAKDHASLLRAMRIVVARFPDVLLRVAGQGPLQDELQDMIHQYGIDDNVRLLGHRDDIFQLLARSDVAVVSSTREGFSLAAVEAMAASLPVVATRVGGLLEVVRHGDTGLLVPPRDPEAMATALIQLLDDLPKRRAMGVCGHRCFRAQFTSTGMIHRLERLYEDLAARCTAAVSGT